MWRVAAASLGLAWILACSIATSYPVVAVESTVSAQVCQDAATANLEITEPQSDTLVRSLPVAAQVAVSLISSIDIYIDGAYQRTVAVPAEASTIDIDIQLPTGTHTVELRGSNLCDGSTVSDTVVLTYQPPPPDTSGQPSVGEQTPTVINPEPNPTPSGGIVVSNPNPTDSEADTPEGLTLWQRIGRWLSENGVLGWVFRVTDTDATVASRGIGWWRPVLFLLGLVLLVGGLRLMALTRLNWFVGWYRDRRRDVDGLIRLSGLLLLVLSVVVIL